MVLERKAVRDLVDIPLFASIEDKLGFQKELEAMTHIFGNACMVIWDELDVGNDALLPNIRNDFMRDVYANTKKIEAVTRQLHEDGELSRYMTEFAKKLGKLCGYFEDSPLAMRMAPLHDIVSTCMVNEVAMRIDGDIFHNEHLARFDGDRRSKRAQSLARDVVYAILDSGSAQVDYDSPDLELTDPEEWNFRYMFNKAYVQAMKDRGMRVSSMAEARVPMV